jgi:hypothetical protein
MLSLSQFLAEQSGAGLTIFDIDETLFRTTAKIQVVKNGKVVRDLDNHTFNTYKLKSGEDYDFGQFRDAKKFHDESEPIEKMFKKAKAILSNATRTGSTVIIITARSDFDDRDTFLNTFRKHGFDIDKVRVERAGNIEGNFVPAYKKAIIIRNALNTGKYKRVRLFDDSMKNLQVFLELQDEFPDIKFEAFLAHSDGSVKTVR